MPGTNSRSLATALAAWNPRYRSIRVGLGALALVAGVTVFGENAVLQSLTLSFKALKVDSDRLWPLALLLFFVGLRLLRIGADVWGRRLLSRLQIRSRAEIESEALAHLQRQTDTFFGSRPIAEILNRLSADVDRALEARDASIRLFRLAVMIVGNLYFFVLQDWRLALVGLATCALGALWMDRIAWPVGRTEKALLERDDRVRSNLEDLLRAAPEVQVGNLFRQSREYIREAQEAREVTFNKVAWLDARLNAVQGITALAGMASLLFVSLYFFTTQSPDAGMALVPIIIKALPELFANTSSVVLQRLSLVRSQTSIQRLLEFDHPGEEDTAEVPVARAAQPVRFEAVGYQYPSPNGVAQGGIHEVTTELKPGRWVAVIGPTGAGKSTFLQVLLGRATPQKGTVRHGEAVLKQLSTSGRAALLSFMPQRLSLLDTSVLANITFGRADSDARDLPASELAIVEATGLGDVCRQKALHMHPNTEELRGKVGTDIQHLRDVAQLRLATMGLTFQKYGSSQGDPQHWVLEHLLRGRCERSAVVHRLVSPAARRPLRRIIETPLGDALVAQGRRTLQGYRSVLRLPTYQQFSRLAPFYLDERTWQLWTQTLLAGDSKVHARADSAMLISVALTSAGGTSPSWDAQPDWATGIALLRRFFAGLWAPFVDRQLHPHMTWRENLLFASVDVRNDRVEQRIEQMLVELLRTEGLADELTRIGLGFQVGRAGARLSGGQGQLVALCRTLLRGTPIVVLDEPTSALDPTSRARIASLLHTLKKDRIIVTSSHDPEFIRQADEVRLFERGQLVRSGAFDSLLRESDTLRDLLRLQTPVVTAAAIRRAL